jgi:hypothetical protein
MCDGGMRGVRQLRTNPGFSQSVSYFPAELRRRKRNEKSRVANEKEREVSTMRSDDQGIRYGDLRSLRMALALFLAASVGAFAAFDRALSEPIFPAKPIQIFIPYGAGGVADLTMRLLAQKLTERTKQQVVIENRPGSRRAARGEGSAQGASRRLHAWSDWKRSSDRHVSVQNAAVQRAD